MKQKIKVYRRESWQIVLILVLTLIILFNLVFIFITYGNSPIPNLWAIPFICLLLSLIICLGWFLSSLDKKPYDMIIGEINRKEQKITYTRLKNEFRTTDRINSINI